MDSFGYLCPYLVMYLLSTWLNVSGALFCWTWPLWEDEWLSQVCGDGTLNLWLLLLKQMVFWGISVMLFVNILVSKIPCSWVELTLIIIGLRPSHKLLTIRYSVEKRFILKILILLEIGYIHLACMYHQPGFILVDIQIITDRFMGPFLNTFEFQLYI